MTQFVHKLIGPVCALTLAACGADPNTTEPSDPAPASKDSRPGSGDTPPDVSNAKPLSVTEVKHAAGSVYFAEVGEGILIAEATDLRRGPSVVEKLKETGGSPLDLFVTLSDDAPSQKLIDNHYSLHADGPVNIDGIERFALPGLTAQQAPCGFIDACQLNLGPCSTSTLINQWASTMGPSPTTQVGVVAPGQLTSGAMFAMGVKADIFFGTCSPTTGVNYTLSVRPAGGTWQSVTVPVNPNIYFFLVYYGGRDAVNDLDFLVTFNNPTKVAALFAFKPL